MSQKNQGLTKQLTTKGMSKSSIKQEDGKYCNRVNGLKSKDNCLKNSKTPNIFLNQRIRTKQQFILTLDCINFSRKIQQ